MTMHYSIVIQWSDEDQAFLVTLPEFGPDPQTHGATYKEAMKHALEVMEMLVEFHQEQGHVLPEPLKYGVKKKKIMHAKKPRRYAGAAK
jgi:predicted RNase H-like HicB family nuclease